MELRFDSARATRDIDLVLNPLSDRSCAINEALAYQHLKQAVALDLSDFVYFEVAPLRWVLEGPIYGGGRFPVTAMMAGRTFVKFAMDVAIAEAPIRPTELYNGEGLLADYGAHPISIPMISREQQFAEKVHAYVTPRGSRPNSRVKDMIDMALLTGDGYMDVERVRAALKYTFSKRDERLPPQEIPPPPQNWEEPFDALAVECGLKISLTDAHLQVAIYYLDLSQSPPIL